jgi:hypothetical protein
MNTIDDGIDALVPMINKLHRVFANLEGGTQIELPQIVVLGA